MRFLFIILCSLLFFPGLSFTAEEARCSRIFGSKLYYQNVAIKKWREPSQDLHPKSENPKDEILLVKKWNEKPVTPPMLETLLPEGVFFVKYQQYQPGKLAMVKSGEPGESLIGRAGYRYKGREFHTNVFFSVRALRNNMKTEKNWLVGENAKAAVLYLHGGGTKSTGAHTATGMITHFAKKDVDVVSIDLAWHAQGHREFLNFETEIQVLSAFVKKYIPPNVPLFVAGHSWGSVFAEQLMLMTANPKLNFHKNLRGVMIFSTAVTGAKSGTSLKEREKEFRRRLEKAKKMIQEDPSLVAEAETYIWEAILKDGKWSPWGGLISTGYILQLIQEIPAHLGRKYIPALVVVGKYDPLVYIGNEDLYNNYYPKLKNVEFPPPLDKLPLSEDSTGKPQKVGHLIGDYKTPDGKHNMQYTLMLDFMETQLKKSAVKSVRPIINARVRESALEAKAKDSITKKLRYLRTLDAITQFIDTNEHIQLLDSHVLSGLKDTMANMRSASVLPVKPGGGPESQMPAFIRIVQSFANDLAFREFIQDHRMYKVKKTKEMEFFRHKQTEITDQLTEILSPYFTNIRRASWFIHQLSEMTGEKGLGRLEELKEQSTALQKERKGLPKGQQRKELREKLTLLQAEKAELQKKIRELQDEMDYLSSPEALQSLGNEALRTMITELKEAFNTAPNLLSSRFTSNTRHAVEHLVERVKQMQKASVVQQELNSIKARGAKNKNNFVTKMLGSKDIDTAMEIINEKQIPESVKTQVQPLLEMGLTMRGAFPDHYIPPVANMGVRERSPSSREHDQGRIDSHFEILKKVITDYKRIQKSYVAWNTRRKELKNQYEKLKVQVLADIKIIRKVLNTLSTAPPESLKNDFRQLERMFEEELLPAEEIMERSLDQLSSIVFKNKEALSQKEVIRLFEKEEFKIQDFSNKFQEYLQIRRELDKKAITAMEAGEKGEEAQQAVIAVYGLGSQGRQPLPGSGSLYMKWQKVTEELAEAEAEMYKLKRLEVENRMRFKEELNSLAGLVSGDKDPESYDMLKRVISSIEPVDLALIDILNLDRPKPDQLLKIESEKDVLADAVDQWHSNKKGMTSEMPAPLPAAAAQR